MIGINRRNDLFKRVVSIIGLTIGLLSTTIIKAENLVTVQLKSGRVYTAQVDHRTNNSHLWLRFQTTSTILLRPIQWAMVDVAWSENRKIDATAFRRLATSLAAEDLKEKSSQGNQKTADKDPVPVAIPKIKRELSSGRSDAQRASDALGSLPRVRSVDFDAHLANWDADVEVDGLMLYVYPRDASGNLVPVSGTLHVELHALRSRAFHDSPRSGGQAIELVGRWAKRVWPTGFNLSEYTYQLPFQARHPDFDLDMDHFGILHLRLVVPGHGVFEDSIDTVRIRPFSPLRDRQQLIKGKRFFAFEQTGRSK